MEDEQQRLRGEKMNQILLLTANIILYLILLFVNFIFQNSFNKKIENFRIEGAKALDMFRDELLKKTRDLGI